MRFMNSIKIRFLPNQRLVAYMKFAVASKMIMKGENTTTRRVIYQYY